MFDNLVHGGLVVAHGGGEGIDGFLASRRSRVLRGYVDKSRKGIQYHELYQVLVIIQTRKKGTKPKHTLS